MSTMRLPVQVLAALVPFLLWQTVHAKPGNGIRGASCSPDGLQLAFVESRRDTGEPDRLLVLDLETRRARVLNVPGFMVEAWYGLDWDPQSQAIVAAVVEGTREEPEGWAIWEIPLSGDKPRKFGIPGRLCQRGIVSPDGKRILLRTAPWGELHMIDRATGSAIALEHVGPVQRLGYDWYGGSSTDVVTGGNGIWAIPIEPEGHKQRTCILPAVASRHVAVSADSKYLAYVVLEKTGGRYVDELWVTSTLGGKPTKAAPNCLFPVWWSPEGNGLLFVADGRARVWSPALGEGGASLDLGPATWATWARRGKSVVCVRNEVELWETDARAATSERIYQMPASSRAAPAGQ